MYALHAVHKERGQYNQARIFIPTLAIHIANKECQITNYFFMCNACNNIFFPIASN